MHWKPRLLAFVILTSLAVFAGCGASDSADSEAPILRVSSAAQDYQLADFVAVGFKEVKTYDIEGLPGATGASFGFWRVPGQDPRNYELRFYPSHEDAVRDGTALADEVTGDDAVLFVEDLTWKEGARDRRHNAVFKDTAGELVPNYMDYMIHGNVVMLCEGAHPEQSLDACSALITALQE